MEKDREKERERERLRLRERGETWRKGERKKIEKSKEM